MFKQLKTMVKPCLNIPESFEPVLNVALNTSSWNSLAKLGDRVFPDFGIWRLVVIGLIEVAFVPLLVALRPFAPK